MAEHGALPWSALIPLLDTLVGPKRDVSICTWRAPALEAAHTGLRSREVREAMLAELQALAINELTTYP